MDAAKALARYVQLHEKIRTGTATEAEKGEHEKLRVEPAVIAESQKMQAAIRATHPHLFWKPNPPQYRFIQMIADGVPQGKWVFLAPWANGVGKTNLWANLMWNIMCRPEHRLPWFNHPTFTDWKFPKVARIVCNPKQVREGSGAVSISINSTWPKSEYVAKKGSYDYDSLFKINTGWIVDVMTFEQDRKEHESATLGLVVIDECCPFEVWSVYPSRMRKGGIIVFLATLLENDEYVEADLMVNSGCGWFYASDEDNCIQHSRLKLSDGTELVGYLEHDHIERISSLYTEHERETRKTGVPIHKKGRAFSITDAHTIQRSQLKDLKLTTYMSVDPHQRKPWFIQVGGIDADGNWYIVDEWPRENFWRTEWPQYGLQFYADKIVELENKWQVAEKIIDSKFASQFVTMKEYARKLSEELMMTYGLYFTGGATDPEDTGACEKLHGLLRYNQSEEVSFSNKPRFYVCSDLHNTNLALRNIRYKEFPDEERYGMSQKLDPKYLDPVRGIFYLIMHRGGYSERGAAQTKSFADRSDAIRRDLKQMGIKDEDSERIALSMI